MLLAGLLYIFFLSRLNIHFAVEAMNILTSQETNTAQFKKDKYTHKKKKKTTNIHVNTFEERAT